MIKTLLKNRLVFNKYNSLINDINIIANNFKRLNNAELRYESFKLQTEYKKTQKFSSLISRSFALTREASYRTLGLKHFDVQLLGGLVLNDSKISEMRTGEGKTLVATLPASLNALTKKGVHIVTVNDYLANRDQVSMGQIYRFLGLTTGLIQEKMDTEKRQQNYQTDITYVTNDQLAFDFLRDNTVFANSKTVLRPFNYCIIDEVDSILIDEAQTPLILSNRIKEKFPEKFVIASEIIKYLEIITDYKINEKDKYVVLTQAGIQKIEKILKVNTLYDINNPWINYILNALRAFCLFFNNIHYIVKNNRVIIVDESTGRLMPDRRWSDGLHQAIEAKEQLPINSSTETQASITYQNFFLMYPKLAGMTGTGKTAEIEFEKIYKLSVNVIPTHKTIKRLDLPDLIYKDQFTKWNAIAKVCSDIQKTGQPILIGTTTIEKSEMLSQLLKEYNLSYQILNAKPENARRESQIIAEAGKQYNITISTNMAGRGTDIILGGNINFAVQKNLYDLLLLAKFKIKKYKVFSNITIRNIRSWHFYKLRKVKKLRILRLCSQKFYSVILNMITNKKFLQLSDIDILRVVEENNRISVPKNLYQCAIRFMLNNLALNIKKYHAQESQIIKNLGGLYVIGTERNNSRRVDNQLRGRCGRQGDPGTSRFFLSLDDTLLRLFGSSKFENFVKNQIPDDLPIEADIINKTLESAQQRIEERAYEQRKNLFDYDDVLNKQRSFIYFDRQYNLKSAESRRNNFAFGEQIICEFLNSDLIKKSTILTNIKIFENFFNKNLELFNKANYLKKRFNKYDFSELKLFLFQQFWLNYQLKICQLSQYNDNLFTKWETKMNLIFIDKFWKGHLEKMNLLRDAVTWRAYGQKNPLTEYKREAYSLFCEDYEVFIYILLYQIFHFDVV